MANTTYVTNVREQQAQLNKWRDGADLQGFDLLAARDAAARHGLTATVRKINAELARKSGNVSGLK